MGHLLQLAEASANRFEFLLDQRRPDLAYIEYLILSDIVLHLIQQHKDYPVVAGDRGKMHRVYKDLFKVYSLSNSNFTDVARLQLSRKLLRHANLESTRPRGAGNEHQRYNYS